ncbi:predicted protein [Botrytis cinerea T4]|uniref:Uncharacterized protein n=1 Tax=Botryotinia fuckeliana (strain T4) TaxID=999810 RepID=G2XQQ0_BOTF4|nr:predicted protein [Botrytis cinerea T4]
MENQKRPSTNYTQTPNGITHQPTSPYSLSVYHMQFQKVGSHGCTYPSERYIVIKIGRERGL